ncbi:hypothetical protein CUU62_26115 [Pseudomonas sp. WP001]|nr:hypothetical protein CUU62_26115 [Pseudomonas sp. WP001]
MGHSRCTQLALVTSTVLVAYFPQYHHKHSTSCSLMRLEGLRSQTGYRRRPGKYGGKPAVASPNLLKRQFDAAFSTPWAAVAPLPPPFT